MAAHLYGRRLAAAEDPHEHAFAWADYPANPQKTGGRRRHSATASTSLSWHTFTASPPEFGFPGSNTLPAPTSIQCDVVEYSGAFLTYLAAAALCYSKDSRSVTCSATTGDQPYLTGTRREKWHAQPSLTRVRDTPTLPQYGSVARQAVPSTDRLLTLRRGHGYGLLVVDLDDETPALPCADLDWLSRERPLCWKSPSHAGSGLTNYPACDAEVGRLADALWVPRGHRPCRGRRPRESDSRFRPGQRLTDGGNSPGFHGPGRFCASPDCRHRYVLSDGEKERRIACFESVAGSRSCGIPVCGRIRDAVQYRPTDDGRTLVPVHLPKNGSLFVVFRRAAETTPSGPQRATGRTAGNRSRTESGFTARVWRPGRSQWEVSGGGGDGSKWNELPSPRVLAGPWKCVFTAGWGAPESTVFEQLVPWNEHPDPGVRHFSGTAIIAGPLS